MRKTFKSTIERVHKKLNNGWDLSSPTLGITNQGHIRFWAHNLNDMHGLVHKGYNLFIPFSCTQISKPFEWVMIVVSQLINFRVTLSKEIKSLYLYESVCLWLWDSDSFIFHFNDVVIGWKSCFRDPLFFERVGVSRTGSPKANFFVLNDVKVT